MLLPRHRQPPSHLRHRQPVRLVASDNLFDDAGRQKGQVEEFGDVGAVQADGRGQGPYGGVPALFEQLAPAQGPGVLDEEVTGVGRLDLAAGQDDLLATAAAFELNGLGYRGVRVDGGGPVLARRCSLSQNQVGHGLEAVAADRDFDVVEVDDHLPDDSAHQPLLFAWEEVGPDILEAAQFRCEGLPVMLEVPASYGAMLESLAQVISDKAAALGTIADDIQAVVDQLEALVEAQGLYVLHAEGDGVADLVENVKNAVTPPDLGDEAWVVGLCLLGATGGFGPVLELLGG